MPLCASSHYIDFGPQPSLRTTSPDESDLKGETTKLIFGSPNKVSISAIIRGRFQRLADIAALDINSDSFVRVRWLCRFRNPHGIEISARGLSRVLRRW
jgi:hypothetical protein